MKGFLKKKKDQSEQADMELELINLDETAGWSRLEVAHELKRQEAAEGESLQADVEMAEELCPDELPERMKTMILTEEAETMEAAESAVEAEYVEDEYAEDEYMEDEYNEEEEYKLVGSSEASSLQNKISNESPFGKALIGAKVGNVVEVEAPAGVVKYKVLSIHRAN